MQCICEHPKFILNPLACELIAEHGNYVIRGHQYIVHNSKPLLYAFKTKNINPHSLRIGHNDIDNCYIVDCYSQEHYPLYLEVACGHCEVCKSSKVNSFVHRCKLETMCYKCKPIFITLTYDELHKKEHGVSLRDCQLFFKRLRINLYRKGYREKIRYVLVSEYGKPPRRLSNGRCTEGYRPHYHAILWNVHQNNILSYSDIKDIIESSWSCGFVMSRFVDPSNDKCFYYTSKYLCKSSNPPIKGYERTFCVSSNRGGGIGAYCVDRYSKHIIHSLDTSARFGNPFNGKTERIQFNRYVLNRVFPSFCRSLPSGLKRHVRTFVLNVELLKSRNHPNYETYKEKAERVVNFFGQLFYVPKMAYSDVKASMEHSSNFLLREILEAEQVIDRALCLGFDWYIQRRKLADERKRFLNKLFLNSVDVDLSNRAYNFRIASNLAEQRLIL